MSFGVHLRHHSNVPILPPFHPSTSLFLRPANHTVPPADSLSLSGELYGARTAGLCVKRPKQELKTTTTTTSTAGYYDPLSRTTELNTLDELSI